MSKNKLYIFLLSFVLVLMLISCSNNTPGASATGLLVGRVGTVFADPNYKYDVAYKNGSTRYIADVTVSLSNGSYTYPSSVKGELLKFDGSNWISVQKNITEQIVFSESGTYKVKYTADGFTADTGEFPVYKPGEIYNFSATKEAYAEGAQMVKSDFTYTYCYKDESGSIGLTSSVTDRDVAIYTRDEQPTFITMLDNLDTYISADKVLAGILIESPENPEGYVKKEIEIKVLKDCHTDIKNLAYYKLKEGIQYEFSGSIYKRFYDNNGNVIGRTAILRKNNSWVEVADGFTIYWKNFFESEKLTDEELKVRYNATQDSEWNLVTDPIKAFITKQGFTNSGYLLIKIKQGDEEITKDNPGYIRVHE